MNYRDMMLALTALNRQLHGLGPSVKIHAALRIHHPVVSGTPPLLVCYHCRADSQTSYRAQTMDWPCPTAVALGVTE